MIDERSHHPLMKVPGVAPAAVVELARAHPALPVLVCGATMADLPALAAGPTILAELSFVESGWLLRDALAQLGPERLLLGTHAPLHYPAAGVAKLSSDELPAETRQRLAQANFERFFGTAVDGDRAGGGREDA
jgi:hypothetical protein